MTGRKVRITIFDKKQYDGDWPPSQALGFINWFQARLRAEVPAEYRDTARIDLDSVLSYEDSYATLCIYYDRPETDEEMATRLREEKWRREREEARERRALATLQAKYGAK